MNLVFKKGDVVYVPTKGRGEIIARDRSDRPYCVKFNEGTPAEWFQEGLLSFEPWPAPVHVRPMKVGWYAVRVSGYAYPFIYHFDGEHWAGNDGALSVERMKEKAKGVTFLGEEMKYE